MSDLDAGRRQLGMTSHDLWMAYFGVGGNGSLDDVRGWLAAQVPLPSRERDLLAQALNDAFCERLLDHPVPYSHE